MTTGRERPLDAARALFAEQQPAAPPTADVASTPAGYLMEEERLKWRRIAAAARRQLPSFEGAGLDVPPELNQVLGFAFEVWRDIDERAHYALAFAAMVCRLAGRDNAASKAETINIWGRRPYEGRPRERWTPE